VFTESWVSPRLQDGDARADVWTPMGGAGCGAAPTVGRLVLGPRCRVATVPHEVRTFNFFRHPMTLTVEGVRASPGSLVRIALAVPSPAAVNRTGWPSVKHYLQPLRDEGARDADTAGHSGGSDAAATAAASLAVTVSSAGAVELLRRRTTGSRAEVLGRATLPAGCGSARVQLFAGATFTTSTTQHGGGSPAPPLSTRLQVFCGGATGSAPAVNISSSLGLGFLDEDGFGETVGEAVLELSTLDEPASQVWDGRAAAHSRAGGATVGRVRITNDLAATFAPAVLAPISDRVGTVNLGFGRIVVSEKEVPILLVDLI
jgi:hypothetical protein